MHRKLVGLYATREVLNLAGMAMALFWSAGRVNWWQAWGAVAVMAGWMVATAIVIVRYSPGLQAELPGYADYARQARFRLVPGIW